ncbi:MAG TPA: hypothetical protein VK400_04375 [Pyrinomonadaceae bacterium]|nr:hypothetical protein [Pyrinomonadaceae bacterium]
MSTKTGSTAEENVSGGATVAVSARELGFELGLWLSGLESFLQVRNHSFASDSANRPKPANRDWTKEFRLVHSTLLLCSKLALQLSRTVRDKNSSAASATAADKDEQIDLITNPNAARFEFSDAAAAEELAELSSALVDSVLLNEGLLRAAPLRFSEWTAWSNFLAAKLKAAAISGKLIAAAEKEGENFLPKKLKDLLENKPIPFALEADLRLVLPRFAKILKWLDAIGQMHDRDEPLKPAMLLFARINEQTQEMMRFINNRLLRFKNEEDSLFAALDCAVYAASIELRKVYNFELVGFAEARQSPLIYARVETAHGLLNDCFQQTLVNFAQLIEPDVKATELFPNLQTKLQQSLTLREDLWRVLQVVRKAEKNPESVSLEKLHTKLTDFLNHTIKYLFYKDLETVERFIEEVLNTTKKSELVSILHRFGAYLETLLGQVNLRTVLSNHPFNPAEE